jgi:hypothetical protein
MTDQSPGIKTAELLVSPPRSDHGLRNMLHALPKGKGWVFGLVIVDAKDEEGRERVMHVMASHLEHLAEDLAEEGNGPRRFEQMLAKLNGDLLEATEDMGLRFDRFHGVVGLLTKNQIFISGIGKVNALFLHKTADRRYSVYELDAQFHEGRSPDDKRFFLTILDGEIHAGDVFYVASQLPSHALSPDELHDILVTLPPNGALQRIRQFVPPSQHYAALGFSFLDTDKGSNGPKKSSPIGSLEALQTSQERTANVLGESNTELSSLVKNLTQAARKQLASPGGRGAATYLKRGTSVFLGGLATFFAALKKLSGNIFLTSQKSSTRLSPQKKLLLVGVFAFLTIGAGLFFLSRGSADKKVAEAAFNETVADIEERITSAEASLIYRNNEEARKALVEAATILETLPRDTGDHQSEAERLTTKLATLQNSIRGITAVTPQALATLEGASPFTEGVSVNGRLYAFTDSLDVYRLDGLSNSFVKEDLSKGSIGKIVSLAPEGANALVLDEKKELGRADFATKALNPIASGTNSLLSVEDIASYGNNLYALSAASEQIVKMRPLGSSYEAGTVWITAKESDLSTARALAIDGDLFVLTKNDVVKLRSGREQDWNTATIDPPLTNPLDLFTDVTTPSLYILDPAGGRIIVLNKESGAMTAQYTSEELKNATAFTVEEGEKRIVFLTGNKAFAFTAEHLVK